MKGACHFQTGRLREAILFTFAIVLAHAANGQVQVYQFSTANSGDITGTVADIAVNSPDLNYPQASIDWTFPNFTETVYFDPVNLTIRQVGVASGLQPQTQVVNETEMIGGQSVSATLTITEQIAGGTFSFDTGTQPITFYNPIQQYIYNGAAGANPNFVSYPTVNGSYSLVTGGQTYTGTFSYSLHAGAPFLLAPPQVFSAFSPSTSGSSLLLDNAASGNFGSTGSPFLNLTAANGYTISLEAGDRDDGIFDSFQWPALTETAYLVPEPGTFTLISVGLTGLAIFRRKK